MSRAGLLSRVDHLGLGLLGEIGVEFVEVHEGLKVRSLVVGNVAGDLADLGEAVAVGDDVHGSRAGVVPLPLVARNTRRLPSGLMR